MNLLVEGSNQPQYTRTDIIEDLKAKFELNECQANSLFSIAAKLEKPVNLVNLKMNKTKSSSCGKRSGPVTDAELASVICQFVIVFGFNIF